MAKPIIVTRLGKGSELSFQEGDDNFTNLKNATVTVAGDSGTSQAIDLNDTVTISGGTGLSSAMTTKTVTLNLDNTAVTAGSYTKASITVDAQGRVTAAANGSADFATADARSAVSATDAGGEGSFAYNSSTGVFTYTGPSFSGLEVTSAKNQANGYAGLDAGGKVASAQLPSYVDDVEEYANQAGFPVTGETSKIYVALDNNKIYRWSGSAYVEISASPGSTDAVTEGSTNLYFTNTRARGAFSASTGITITDGAVATTITQYTDAGARAAVSVTDAGGDGSLAYNSGTGVITYTGPSASEVRAHFTAGTGITITSGAIATTITQYTDASARSAISVSGSLSYNSSTGVISYTAPTAFDPASPGAIGGTTPAAVTATTLTSTGRTVIKDLTETVYSLTYASTITPDVANGTVQKVTLTGNVTFSAFSNPVAGQSLTLIVTQDATGSRTLTSTMKFSGAAKTLTTAANSIDIITVFYDGTNYYASLGKGFA